MDNCKTKINSLLGDALLGDALKGAGTPVLVSLLFSNGEVQRRICFSETDVETLLIGLGLSGSIWTNFSRSTGYSERIRSLKATVPIERGLEDVEVIIEQVVPSTKIIIFGAGHVGKAVTDISARMGWDITIIDDRMEFLDRVEESEVRINKINEPFADVLKKVGVNKTSALVIVTRGHQFDEICLEESLETEAFYIGMIGSRRRVASIVRKLREKGIAQERLATVHAPIGIEINARTPQEIAIAIIAEIIKVKNSVEQPG